VIMSDKICFGTDGIRCLFEHFPLQVSILPSIGYGVGQWMQQDNFGASNIVVMGRDTRTSGLVICNALCQGLQKAGIHVWDAGVVPTPAISFLARHYGCVGLMVSASHNPAPYNGIKFFNALGEKLSLHQEDTLLTFLNTDLSSPHSFAESCAVDRILTSQEYEEWLCQVVGSIKHIRVVVDAANGALHAIALRVLQRCGASVVGCYGMAPNGQNINAQCGSLHPENVQKAVRDTGADLGLCFDGDGDRVIVVDHQGTVQDGDQILGFLSTQDDAGPGIVGTVMSNMALESFIRRTKGSDAFVRTRVGDRWIAQCLQQKQWHLGGEACGHIVRADILPTGDGLLIGLFMAKAVAQGRCVFPIFQPMPSLVDSLALPHRSFLETSAVRDWATRYDAMLTQRGGRFLMRPSGTEPKVRLLIEAPDSLLVTETMRRAVTEFQALQSDASP
jgi:phosphoglucosamine mutase